MESGSDISVRIEAIYRRDSGMVLGTLIKLLGNIDLAEDALQEAFAAALRNWSENGVPQKPAEWLISAGKFRAIDAIRKKARHQKLEPELALRLAEIEAANDSFAEREIKDDRLRLVFACCHPAIDVAVQVPLTLREVCGLTTEEIASAFLVSKATMAQRIVRGKAKIRDAGIPFSIPAVAELPERLDAVLAVVYLVFNEGYSASTGSEVTRVDLTQEAIRLARLVLELLPDPEVKGLLALMLLHESRRKARVDTRGDLVLLEHQDRRLWDRALIAEGGALVEAALATRRFGGYALQAAISALHAEAASSEETDWPQIVALYDVLARIDRSPVVALNRAVALAMRDGPETGLTLIDALMEEGRLDDYHLAHSARGELLRRVGRLAEARSSLEQALRFVKQGPEGRFLKRRIAELDAGLVESG